jgi:FAD:protein FMN transferase
VHEGVALGSPLRLAIVGADASTAARAWTLVTEEFAAVDRAMSRYRTDSEVTRLNRELDVDSHQVGPRLHAALVLADRAWRATGGRFDPRVLRDLERLGDVGAEVRPPGRLTADGRSGPPRDRATPPVRFEGDRTILEAPIDLGGLGKGLALRWATRRIAAILPATAGALLDAGGDLVATGEPVEDGWSIAIEDPLAPLLATAAPPVAVVRLSRGAIVTSSIRRRRWSDPRGREVHHLIDPSTGEPGGGGLVAVTVAAPDAAWGEVWSKALFLAGPRAIAAEAESRATAVWWVGHDGRVGMTRRAMATTVWLA